MMTGLSSHNDGGISPSLCCLMTGIDMHIASRSVGKVIATYHAMMCDEHL